MDSEKAADRREWKKREIHRDRQQEKNRLGEWRQARARNTSGHAEDVLIIVPIVTHINFG